MGSHHGAVGGRLRPTSRPVTAALRSPILMVLCVSFCQRYSNSMAEAVASATTIAALKPKKYMPAMVVGARAIRTSPIRERVFCGLRTCGAVDI